MKKMKALSLLLAAALTVSSVAVTPGSVDAAKAPKLSKTKATIKLGATVKLTVKNAKTKAKITWKTSKKSVAKITKKNGKGKKNYATVKGVKAGKATITATYKLGKKAKKLTCKVTVKKATNVTPTPVAVTNPPVITTAPTAAPTKVPATPSKTPRPTKTPTPVPTEKPKGEEVAGAPDVIDVMATSVLETAAGIVATKNDDGSVTLDFSGTSYVGARWYFGTPAEKEGDAPVKKSLNLEKYSYVVVEGVNQAGVTADKDGKVHDLNAQLLDGVDINTGHGGPLEIDTQKNVGFPIKFDLTDPNTRTNVAAFEIYSLDKKESTKAGPITVKSIKIYKDKATYDKEQEASKPTPTTKPTPTPVPEVYTLDLSKTVKYQDNGTVTVNDDGSVTGAGVDAILIPMTKTYENGSKFKVIVEGSSSGVVRSWISDEGGNNAYSNQVNPITFGEPFELTSNNGGKCVLQIKKESYNSPALENITIKKVTIVEDGATIPTTTPRPTETPEPTPTAAPTPTPIAIDLSKATALGGKGTVTFADGVVTGTSVEGIVIPIGSGVKKDEKYAVTIYGEASGAFRSWISDEGGWTNLSAQIKNPAVFEEEFIVDITADNDKAAIQVKMPSGGSAFESFIITDIKLIPLKKFDTVPTATPAPTPTPIVVEAEKITIETGDVYEVDLDPENTDVTKKDGSMTYDNGSLSIDASNVYGDLFEVAVPNGTWKSVEIVFSDYNHTAGVAPDYYGICYKHIVDGADRNVTTLPQTGNKFVVDFDEADYDKVNKLVFFSVGTSSKIKIESITLKNLVTADANKYVLPEEAETVFVKGTVSDKAIDEEIVIADYIDALSYIDEYKDAYASLKKMADASVGTIISKPVGDKDVVYTVTAANKGTITVDDKSVDVEFVQTADTITAKSVVRGHAIEATVKSGVDGIINVKKDGVDGYVVKYDGDSEAFTVNCTTPSGKVLVVEYDGASVTVITTADTPESVDVEVSYTVAVEDAE